MPKLDIIGRTRQFYSVRGPERLVSVLEPLLYGPVLSAVFESLPPYKGEIIAGWQNPRVIDPNMRVLCRRSGDLQRDYFATTMMAVSTPRSEVKFRARTIGEEVRRDRDIVVVPRHLNQFCSPESLTFLFDNLGIHLVAIQSRLRDATEPHIVSVTGHKSYGYVGEEAVEWAEDTMVSIADSLSGSLALVQDATKIPLDPKDIEFNS